MIGRTPILAWVLGIMFLGIMLLATPAAVAKGPANFMMSTEVEGKRLEGQPLLWDRRDMCLLSRDGAFHVFPNKSAKNSRKIERSFYPYKSSEMKTRLREEFGPSFQVGSSEHFVAVYPKDSQQKWPDLMESLYRSFNNSMRVRGIKTKKPSVIMVAVIFRNQGDYISYFAKKGIKQSRETLGHYEHKSNRVFLFDDGTPTGTLDTAVHEATHQTAFNVGVHQRFLAEQPCWLVEGLAMMFETPGMREAWSIQSRSSRINANRLRHFQEYLERRPKGALLRLIASDQPFQTAALDSYAEAWLLSFYLFETRSQDYSRYLARVAARPPLSLYPARERVADFADAFGSDLSVLENQMLRFLAELE